MTVATRGSMTLAIDTVQPVSDSVSPATAVGGCRSAVAASRHAVGPDVAADGDAGDPEQPGGRPHREPLQLRLLNRLPARDLPASGSAELRAPRVGSGDSAVARTRHRYGCSDYGEPPERAPGAEPRGDALVVRVPGELGERRPQHARTRRCLARGDRLTVVLDGELAARPFHHLHPRPGVAGPPGTGEQLQRAPGCSGSPATPSAATSAPTASLDARTVPRHPPTIRAVLTESLLRCTDGIAARRQSQQRKRQRLGDSAVPAWE